MQELELILNKIQELLNYSTEQVSSWYPILRQQYMIYNLFSGILSVSLILLIALGVGTALFYYTAWEDYMHDAKAKKEIQELTKIICICFVVLVVLSVTSHVLVTVLAPDILIIKEFVDF